MQASSRKEAAVMEFTITCPIDGPVTVSLEDIDTVVLREAERADITFVCPHCGTEISVSAVVPSFLMAAIEALAEDGDSAGSAFAGMFESATQSVEPCSTVVPGDPVAEAYCEYFHRQLAHIECAEDMLAEIDANR
jgi:hypothetical protein